MPDMLILVAPAVVIALWCLALLLLLLRRWKTALVVCGISVVLNVWTEQVPINPLNALQLLTDEQQRFPARKAPGAIRVLEYNICGKVEFVPNHGQEFIDFMLRSDADILFLPENNPGTAPEMDDSLKAHYPYSMQLFEGRNRYVSERTLYSRYPLSNPRFYHLDAQQMLEWDPQLDTLRVQGLGTQFFIFEAEADVQGHPVTLMHVHLRTNSFDIHKIEGDGRREKVYSVYENLEFGYKCRSYESQVIADSLKNCPNPLLICGDFNDLSGSVALRRIQSCRDENIHPEHRDRLKNAWWEGGTGLGFTFADQHLRLRLDHILYSKEFDLVDVTIPKVHYSDHRPIIADFNFNP